MKNKRIVSIRSSFDLPVLALTDSLDYLVTGQLRRQLVLLIFDTSQLRVLLEDVLHKSVIIFCAGVVQQCISPKIDLFLEEKVGGVCLHFGNHLFRLVCYHQSDQIVVYRCTYLLLEGGITHNIVYLYIQHKNRST